MKCKTKEITEILDKQFNLRAGQAKPAAPGPMNTFNGISKPPVDRWDEFLPHPSCAQILVSKEQELFIEYKCQGKWISLVPWVLLCSHDESRVSSNLTQRKDNFVPKMCPQALMAEWLRRATQGKNEWTFSLFFIFFFQCN